MSRIIRIAFGLWAVMSASAAMGQGLNLTVENVRNDTGAIVVLVFDNATAFESLDHEGAVDFAEIPAAPGRVRHDFPNLTGGPYAVILFHDENGDWDVNYTDERWLEGVGATGAPNPEDLPDFRQASVWPGPVTVVLHYDQ